MPLLNKPMMIITLDTQHQMLSNIVRLRRKPVGVIEESSLERHGDPRNKT